MRLSNTLQSFHAPLAGDQQSAVADATLRPNDPSESNVDKPSFTVDQAARQITRTGHRWFDANRDGITQISYSFNKHARGHTAFNATQKEQARRSMQSWEDVANVSFQEGSRRPEGLLAFSNSTDYEVAFGQYPGQEGKVLINPRFGTNTNPALHNHGRMTLTHEIGHNLGLLHPGTYNFGNPNYPDHALYAQDTRAYSVMSYFDAPEAGKHFNGKLPSAPMMDDIAAAQRVYGANNTTRNSDTTYGFNSNAGRDYLELNSRHDTALFCVWDGGGVDTLDFSKYHQNQTINLRAESFSDVGGLVGNVSIAKGVTLENAIGGSGHDSIIGNQANNVLKGGAGADRLRGAGGADTFAYDNASDSTPEYPDQIMDFVTGVDRIDLSNLLGNAGVDALRFVRRLTGKPGEAILDYNRTTNLSRLAIDLTGNGRFDFFLKAYGPINVPDIITANPGRQRYA